MAVKTALWCESLRSNEPHEIHRYGFSPIRVIFCLNPHMYLAKRVGLINRFTYEESF